MPTPNDPLPSAKIPGPLPTRLRPCPSRRVLPTRRRYRPLIPGQRPDQPLPERDARPVAQDGASLADVRQRVPDIPGAAFTVICPALLAGDCVQQVDQPVERGP